MAQQTIQIADKPTLDEVKALLENSGYGLEALQSLISSSSSGGGVVKSVQRGKATGSASDINITISTVDPNKCLVIINGGVYYSPPEHYNICHPYVKDLTSDTLSICGGFYNGSASSSYYFGREMSWQVIEFY